MNRRRRNLIAYLIAASVAVAVLVAVVGWPSLGRGNPLGRLLLRSQPPIRVGLLHSRTGWLAIREASVLDAEQFAIDEVNAEGGIDGRRVVPIVVDCRSDPTEFGAAAGRLLDKEGVAALFGGWTSECRKAMVPVVEERSGLLFFPGNHEGLEVSRRVVYAGGSANQTVLPAVRWAFDTLKARRFFVVGLEEVWSRSCVELARDAVRAAGAEVVGESIAPLARLNIETTIEAIRRDRPDVILNFLFGEANGAFYQAFSRAGLKPETTPTIAFGFSEDEARSFVLAHVVGHYAGWNYFQSLDRPENREFIRRFRARFGETRTVGDAMVAAYNSVRLWAQTAREVGSVEVEAVLNNLDRQSFDAPDGIVTIESDTRVVWRPCHVGRLRPEGQFEIVYSIQRPIRPVAYPATRTVDEWRAFLANLRTRWGGRWSFDPTVGASPPAGPADPRN